ncbi:hypothetical protein ACFSUK_19015 [Sphingobium scionense]|uniref:Uncharacterized protein n=1 Tax=Sphingobium scionense TaxID=1404341 RepID=A0A7W6LV36_9SPHN|nr:hypothetical protein [Sphingobium scionense]MBB4151025.1 hypothetical protein [Sphingobium scionense]
MTDPASRPWQLLIVGPGIRFITPEVGNQLVRVFDLSPQTRLIEIETDEGDVSVSRVWPSEHLERVAAIEADIDAIPGIRRMTVFQSG